MAKTINLEKIVNEKAGNGKVPKFVIWLLKKIIHEKRINEILEGSGDATGVAFTDYVLHELDVKIEVSGLENIDKSKKYIFASNHPLGGLDGMSLLSLFGHEFDGKICCIANDILMYLPLTDISVPLNKLSGGQSKNISSLIDDALLSDNQFVLFPAGTCSRFRFKTGIYDSEWKKAFIKMAIKHERDIVPVFFSGRNSVFFYALSYIRILLGVKVNIEMIFFPHEMFWNSGKRFKVYIGKPIAWQTFDKSKPEMKWAEKVKKIAYSLKK